MAEVMKRLRRGPWRPRTLGLPERSKVRVAVGARLRQWRLAAGMTEQMAATLMDRSVEDLVNVEIGQADVSVVDLLMFAEVYGASLPELLEGDVPRVPTRRLRDQLEFAREIDALPKRLQVACREFVSTWQEELGRPKEEGELASV